MKFATKKLLAFIIVFAYIFGWRVTGLIDAIQLVSLLFAAYALSQWRMILARATLLIGIIIAAMAAYALAALLATQSEDFTLILKIVRTAITLLGGLGIVLYMNKELHLTPRNIAALVAIALIGHGLIMIGMYVSRPIRIAVYAATDGPRFVNQGTFLGVSQYDLGVRVMGLTYGLSSTSVLQMVGIFLLPLLFPRSLTWSSAVFVTSGTIIAASSVISGRSGAVILAILVPMYFFAIANAANVPLYIKRNIFASSVMFVSVAFFAYAILASSSGAQLSYTVSHLNEIGQVARGESGTFHALERMWIWPESEIGLLFGTGTFGRAGPVSLLSDIGIVQHVHAYGIIGSLLFWAPMILMICIVLKRFSVDPILCAATVLVLLSSVLFNFKEEALYERCMWSVQCLLWACVLASKNVISNSGNSAQRETLSSA